MNSLIRYFAGLSVLSLMLHVAPLFAQQVQWCAVTSAGQVVFCFPTKEACDAMKVSGQTCVAMPAGK